MAEHKTLFILLGVDRDAGTDKVEAAWIQNVRAAQGHQVSPEVTDAYHILRDPAARAAYLGLLHHCEKQIPATVSSDEEAEKLKRACNRYYLKVYSDPARRPHVFHIRWPEDADPNADQPAPTPPLPKTAFQELRAALWAALMLRPLLKDDISAGTKVWITVLYIFVFSTMAGATYVSSRYALGFYQRVHAVNLETAIRSQHAVALDKFHQVEEAENSFRSNYRTSLGMSVDNTDTPPDLRRCILNHTSVKDAWQSAAQAEISETEILRVKTKLDEIFARIAAGSFLEEDRDWLTTTIEWEEKHLQAFPLQPTNVKHIKDMLNADRFAEDTKSLERSVDQK